MNHTPQQIATAARRAADFIEANPGRYNFSRVVVPRSYQDKGCAVGWLVHFLDPKLGGCGIEAPGHKSTMAIYDAMGLHGCCSSPRAAVRGLRDYAAELLDEPRPRYGWWQRFRRAVRSTLRNEPGGAW